MKLGVFDSGVGGLAVVNAIKQALPNLEIVYKDDAAHVPYGTRSIEEIHGFIRPIMQQFIEEGCRAIVIACNTVTTNLIEKLRQEFDIPFIGMEPMVKPAAESTRAGVIAVCATPRTLTSTRYAWLKEHYAKNVKVVEPDCSDWALMIEANNIQREKIAKTIENICSQGADQIVLGCTHYHWIEAAIKQQVAGRAVVIQPEGPVIEQIKRVLGQLT